MNPLSATVCDVYWEQCREYEARDETLDFGDLILVETLCRQKSYLHYLRLHLSKACSNTCVRAQHHMYKQTNHSDRYFDLVSVYSFFQTLRLRNGSPASEDSEHIHHHKKDYRRMRTESPVGRGVLLTTRQLAW
jgi:hypothetical protein